MSDTERAALALGTDRLELEVPAVVERFSAGERQEPGLPAGVRRQPDGKFKLEQVAIVRVPSLEPVAIAKGMTKTLAKRSILLGIGAGVITSALIQGVQYRLTARPSEAITAPCAVARVVEDAVVCRQAGGDLVIHQGQLFPEGRFRLDSPLPKQNGFAATRISDRRSVTFQIDPHIVVPSTGDSNHAIR